MAHRLRVAGLASLAFFALILLWLGSYFGLYMQTDGFAIVGAMLVMQGDVPFRDFAGYTPPGSFYILVAVFRLFGESVLAARFAFSTVPKWLIVVLVYHLTRRAGMKTIVALAGAAFATLALGNGTFAGQDYGGAHPTVLSTLLALAATAAHVEFLVGGPPGWLLAAGALTGLNVFVRYDLALYAFFAFIATHLILRSRAPLRWYSAGLLGAVIPPALYFLWMVPLADLRVSLIDYPRAYLYVAGFSERGFVTRRIREAFHLPFGPDFWKLFWLYDAYRYLAFLGLIWAWVKRGNEVMTAVLLLGTFLLGYYVKSGNLYSFPIPFFILLPCLISLHWNSKAARVAAACMIWMGYLMWYYKLVLPLPGSRQLDVAAAKGIYLSREETAVLEPLVREVQALVPPEGRIFIYDRVFDVADPPHEMLYFLTQRAPGTSYFHLQPGITDREEAQKRIVEDLARVDLVIETDRPNPTSPMNASGPILDGFLVERFRERSRHGRYRILTAK